MRGRINTPSQAANYTETTRRQGPGQLPRHLETIGREAAAADDSQSCGSKPEISQNVEKCRRSGDFPQQRWILQSTYGYQATSVLLQLFQLGRGPIPGRFLGTRALRYERPYNLPPSGDWSVQDRRRRTKMLAQLQTPTAPQIRQPAQCQPGQPFRVFFQ